MIEIPLSQGQVALIDDEDKELALFKWHAYWDKKKRGYYAKRNVHLPGGGWDGFILHRCVMERLVGRPLRSDEHVNHIDGSRTLDCRRSNLTPRPVSALENNRWRVKAKHNTSGYKGVSWHVSHGKWAANIRSNKKATHLGYFDDIFQAVYAYDLACIEKHGEFAMPNFPREAYGGNR